VSHPTLHFALYDTTPSYDQIHVFGCACYPNTSATAPHKLSPRSTRCLFLGYSLDYKGYHSLTLSSTTYSYLVMLFSTKMCFPLLAPPYPTISTLSLSSI
jgi:hypothetical protein